MLCKEITKYGEHYVTNRVKTISMPRNECYGKNKATMAIRHESH